MSSWNNGVNTEFPWASSSTYMGYSYKDLVDTGMYQKVMLEMDWYRNKNKSALYKFLAVISSGQPVIAKSFNWAIGDGEQNTTVLTENYVAGTDTRIVFENLDYYPGMVLYVKEMISSVPYTAKVKLTSINVSTTGYAATLLECTRDDTKASATPTFTTNATVSAATSTKPLDGKAPEGTFIVPKQIGNVVERVREAVAVGTHTNADSGFMFDRGIAFQAKLKRQTFYERMNTKLYMSDAPKPVVDSTNTSEFAGLNYFFHPGNPNPTTFHGAKSKTKVFTGTTIDRREMEAWLFENLHYGSDKRVIFTSPQFAQKIFYSMLDSSGPTATMQLTQFSIPGTTFSMWEGFELPILGGSVYIIPDFSLTGKKQYVKDEANSTYNADWGVMIDPENVGTRYTNVPEDGGVQAPGLRNVQLSENDSRQKMEWNTEFSLFVKRPEVGAFFSLDGLSS